MRRCGVAAGTGREEGVEGIGSREVEARSKEHWQEKFEYLKIWLRGEVRYVLLTMRRRCALSLLLDARRQPSFKPSEASHADQSPLGISDGRHGVDRQGSVVDCPR